MCVFEITLRHGCSPINLLHVFRTPFNKNPYGELLQKKKCFWQIMCKNSTNTNLTFSLFNPYMANTPILYPMSILIHTFRMFSLGMTWEYWPDRSSHPEVFSRRGILKICSKFAGEHPCQSVTSTKLQSNFIEIALRCGCSPVNLLHIFRAPFPSNISGRLLRVRVD